MRPRSLTGRVTLLVTAVFVIAFVAQVVVLQWQFFSMATTGVFHATTGRAQVGVRLMQQATPAERTAVAASLGTANYKVTLTPPAYKAEQLLDEPEMLAKVREQLGSEARLMFGGDELLNIVAIGVPIDGQAWWFIQDLGPPPSLPFVLLLVLAMLAVAAGVGLLFGARVLARPLLQLAQDIGHRQSLLRAIEIGRGDSTELQRIKQAFNELVHSVARSHETRQQLLAGVSHDLRTPLTRLRLRLETQTDGPPPAEMLADLDGLERIVNQFLAYVHGQSDAASGRLVPMSDMVEQIVAQYPPSQVRGTIAPLDSTVPEMAMQRLLGNLIDNALDHGAAPVRVHLHAGSDGAAVMTVYDSGPGMSPDEFLHAQQPFVRLDSGRNANGHCGLGLAIVAQVADQLGGRLGVAHDAQRGFGISVHLPR
jgi:two-component system, OmpR family, osmolarity sensor histidine kinase EnvZ